MGAPRVRAAGWKAAAELIPAPVTRLFPARAHRIWLLADDGTYPAAFGKSSLKSTVFVGDNKVLFSSKNFLLKSTTVAITLNLTIHVWNIKYRQKKLIAQFGWKSRDERFETN
jgi:hypothetical protein